MEGKYRLARNSFPALLTDSFFLQSLTGMISSRNTTDLSVILVYIVKTYGALCFETRQSKAPESV